jgi:hypothetical protein
MGSNTQSLPRPAAGRLPERPLCAGVTLSLAATTAARQRLVTARDSDPKVRISAGPYEASQLQPAAVTARLLLIAPASKLERSRPAGQHSGGRHGGRFAGDSGTPLVVLSQDVK